MNPRAEELTRKLTAWRSFDELLKSPDDPSYRPTFSGDSADEMELADLYDAAQAERQDPRRAYRGGARDWEGPLWP